MKVYGKQIKPAPNEFLYFAEEYYSRCKDRFDAAEVMTAKWEFEDLIPGLSDFDSRIIVNDNVDAAEHIKFDDIVYEVHNDLCREYPRWSRILEHTPGICLSWGELFNPKLYHPETRLWSYYLGNEQKFKDFDKYLNSISWSDCDEQFYLDKFLLYFSPYQRGIDPPVNLGIFEPEYDWHSRAMHYFTPAVQAGLAVVKKKVCRGKHEALRQWKEILGKETIFDDIFDMTASQYRNCALGNDEKLAEFETNLFEVLKKIKSIVLENITIIETTDNEDVDQIRRKVKAASQNPLTMIFNGVRFCRIRKGRYLFYLNAPEYFETDFLIANEFIKWNQQVLIKAVFSSYGKLKCDKVDATLDEIIEAMLVDVISSQEAEIMRIIYKYSFDLYEEGKEKELLVEMMPYWVDYYVILEKLLADAKKLA